MLGSRDHPLVYKGGHENREKSCASEERHAADAIFALFPASLAVILNVAENPLWTHCRRTLEITPHDFEATSHKNNTDDAAIYVTWDNLRQPQKSGSLELLIRGSMVQIHLGSPIKSRG